MKNEDLLKNKKRIILKRITKDGKEIKKIIGPKTSNSNELILNKYELYQPVKFDDLINLNKKKYRNLKVKILKENLEESLRKLNKAIDGYRELINRTEFWERKSTYEFNFEDWNTLKKANGKLTRYFNEIKKIYGKIESEEL